MSLRVTSYNVLADAYINPAWYPRTPAEMLAPGARRSALVEAIAALDADLVCLQEVEAGLIGALVRDLGARYAFEYARKAGRKPDGCATLTRQLVTRWWPLHYADGEPASGHVALAAELEHDGRPLLVVNTHLRWNPPERRGRDHIGYRQAAELLERCAGRSAIICGDFNVTADSDVSALFADHGLVDAYASQPDAHTCNPNGTAKRIDFLLHTGDLVAEPQPLPRIADDTPLPSAAQPSDHLAIGARFDWR